MSLFGAGQGGGSGSKSLIDSLNIDTSAGLGTADPAAKRKSIFEPSSTTEARAKSNMFGTTPASTGASTGGLFGGTTTSTTAAGAGSGSLFGSTTATTSNTGGLFNLGKPPATASNAGGLLGNTTSQPSQSGGLFGSTQSKPLFGAAPTTATATAQNTTNTAATPSLFGAQPTQPAASTFSQSAAPQLQNAAQQQQQAPANQALYKESVYFNGLLERQKKKIKFDASSDRIGLLPSMNMDLGDLTRRAQELNQKNQASGHSTARDSRAHYLLSGSGVVPGQAYRDFQHLGSEQGFQPQQTRPDFAEESSAYLKGIQARGREAMLRESMDRIYRDVDNFIEQSLGVDFDEQKRKIMQHFGLIPKDAAEDDQTPSESLRASKSRNKSARRSIFGQSALNRSLIGSTGAAAGTSTYFGDSTGNAPMHLAKNQSVRDLRTKERTFIEKIEALNKARLQQSPYKILHEFKEAEGSVPSDASKQLLDAYSALQEITRETDTTKNLRERCFADAHAKDDNSSSSRATLLLKKQIIDGSRSHLEKSFWRELTDVIEKNPRTAALSGRPTVVNKVRAYIRVRNEQHNLAPDGIEVTQIENGDAHDYCWVIIFYLLRSGYIQEAVEYVNSNPAFLSLDRRFVGYLSSYASSPDRKLSRKMQEMVDGFHQQLTRVAPKGTTDPYRVACLKIIGRCDLQQRNLESIGQGVEDWIWLQFALARQPETPEDAIGDVFGLEQIVETIAEIGDKHFQRSNPDSANSYGTYFLMQVLAGMFEQAIDYLHAFNPISAVHFAIALDYYGLLRVSNFEVAGNDLLTFSTTNKPMINFVPLIAFYTGTFRIALPIQAVDYLALICLNSDLHNGELFTNACHETLRELCLETREFAALLGDITADGRRLPGAIEQRAAIIGLKSHEQFLKSILSQSAAVADSRGQVADAVLLYHLCDDYDRVVSVINRALADAIAVELGEEPMSLQPLKPRGGSNGSDTASQASRAPNSSLSLTQGTSSPLELARNIFNLYKTSDMFTSKIGRQNMDTCMKLMIMMSARAKLEHPTDPRYLEALEEIDSLKILPLDCWGDISMIRQMATSFSSLPQVLVRCAGTVILWSVRAIGAEKDRLAREGSYRLPGVSDKDHENENVQLSNIAKDLMVFAGLVRYKLPNRVYDMLTRAGSDIGGY